MAEFANPYYVPMGDQGWNAAAAFISQFTATRAPWTTQVTFERLAAMDPRLKAQALDAITTQRVNLIKQWKELETETRTASKDRLGVIVDALEKSTGADKTLITARAQVTGAELGLREAEVRSGEIPPGSRDDLAKALSEASVLRAVYQGAQTGAGGEPALQSPQLAAAAEARLDNAISVLAEKLEGPQFESARSQIAASVLAGTEGDQAKALVIGRIGRPVETPQKQYGAGFYQSEPTKALWGLFFDEYQSALGAEAGAGGAAGRDVPAPIRAELDRLDRLEPEIVRSFEDPAIGRVGDPLPTRRNLSIRDAMRASRDVTAAGPSPSSYVGMFAEEMARIPAAELGTSAEPIPQGGARPAQTPAQVRPPPAPPRELPAGQAGVLDQLRVGMVKPDRPADALKARQEKRAEPKQATTEAPRSPTPVGTRDERIMAALTRTSAELAKVELPSSTRDRLAALQAGGPPALRSPRPTAEQLAAQARFDAAVTEADAAPRPRSPAGDLLAGPPAAARRAAAQGMNEPLPDYITALQDRIAARRGASVAPTTPAQHAFTDAAAEFEAQRARGLRSDRPSPPSPQQAALFGAAPGPFAPDTRGITQRDRLIQSGIASTFAPSPDSALASQALQGFTAGMAGKETTLMVTRDVDQILRDPEREVLTRNWYQVHRPDALPIFDLVLDRRRREGAAGGSPQAGRAGG